MRGLAVSDHWPALAVPFYTVEVHFAACLRFFGVEAVVEHPVVAGIVGHEVGVVAGANHVLVAFEHQREAVVQSSAAFFVDEGPSSCPERAITT